MERWLKFHWKKFLDIKSIARVGARHAVPLLCFVLFISGFSAAQEQNVYTLEQCISIAKENNLRLRLAENSLRSAELSHSELRTTALPQLHIAAGATYAPLSPKFGYDPAVTSGGVVNGQVVLQQSLYDAGIRGIKSSQFEIDREQFARSHARDERDVVLAVKQNFIEILRAKREAALQSQSLEQLGDYRLIVKGLFKGGIASHTDELKTEIQYSTASLALQKAIDVAHAATYSLAEVMGISIDTSFDVRGSLDSIAFSQNVDPVNYSRTLDVEIAQLGIDRSMLEIDLARHEKLPVVSLFGDAGILSSVENIELPAESRASIFGFSVGVSVEVPLLNWGATGLRVRERILATDALRFQAELLRRSIHSETERTRIDLKSARERLRSVRANIATAEENFLLTKSKFVSGSALSMEVLAAQQLVTDIKLSELGALADIASLAAKLERLTASY